MVTGPFRFSFFRLEPLLFRIKEKRSAILCPGIDMISEQNMGYGVRHACEDRTRVQKELALIFSRERVMGVSEDSGGRCISIGCRYHNAFAMHRNQELTLIRASCLLLGKTCEQRLMCPIFRSPTMAGGLLAAHREYFFEVGGYGKRCSAGFSLS
jgi:hypothetical protein